MTGEWFNFMTTSKSKYLIITLLIFWKGSLWYCDLYFYLTVILFWSISVTWSLGLAYFMATSRLSLTLAINGLNSLFAWTIVIVNPAELYFRRVYSRSLKNSSLFWDVMWTIDKYFTCLSTDTRNEYPFI